MGKPAARMGDPTAHGGTIIVGFPTVLVGGKPAARIGDMHVCPMVNPGPVPHVGGPIITGSPTVLIGGMPAARMGDMATCVGPPDTIAMGCPTVLIGEGGGGVGAAGATVGAKAGSFAVNTKRRGGLFGAIVGGIIGAIVGAVAGVAIGGLPGAIAGGIVGAISGAAAGYALTSREEDPLKRHELLKKKKNGEEIYVTDKGREVETFDKGGWGTPSQEESDAVIRDLGFEGKIKQTTPASDNYDCHGYTFTGGEKWINNDQVQMILDDNGYSRVGPGTHEPVKPGDIVVYRKDTQVTHTGIVREVDNEGNPTLIESKWGALPRYEHAPEDVPPSYYDNPSDIEYYHTDRKGP